MRELEFVLLCNENLIYPAIALENENIVQALKNKFTASSDPAERQAIWSEIQELIYEQVPTMKTGDVYTYNIASPKLAGLGEQTLIWPSFWNVSK